MSYFTDDTWHMTFKTYGDRYGCLENCPDLSYSVPDFKSIQKVIFMSKKWKIEK